MKNKSDNDPRRRKNLTTSGYYSKAIDNDTGKPIWRAKFATVYDITPEHGRWTKDLDILYQLFFEENDLLTPLDLFLYNFHKTRANRSDREKTDFNLETLAARCKCDKKAIVSSLDRLQDAFLIHKICRLDLRGQPHDIIIHNPPTRKIWNEGLGARIIERVKTQETRIDRASRMTQKAVNANAQTYQRLTRDRRNCCPPDKRVNFKELLDNIGGVRREQDEFVSIILDQIFELSKNEETVNWIHLDDRFRQQLDRAFNHYGVVMTQSRWTAAFDVRRIFAPRISYF